MCRLCNTEENKSITKKQYGELNTKHTKEFVYIVEDYTRDFPCKKCIAAYCACKTIAKKQNKDMLIDKMIIDKLFRRLIVENLDNYDKAYSKIERKTFSLDLEKKKEKSKREKEKTEEETIMRNIRRRKRKGTFSELFIVQVYVNNQRIVKSFKTINEAILFRNTTKNRISPKTNTGVEGISFNKKENVYIARIYRHLNGETIRPPIYVGRFKKLEDAEKSRNKILKKGNK